MKKKELEKRIAQLESKMVEKEVQSKLAKAEIQQAFVNLLYAAQAAGEERALIDPDTGETYKVRPTVERTEEKLNRYYLTTEILCKDGQEVIDLFKSFKYPQTGKFLLLGIPEGETAEKVYKSFQDRQLNNAGIPKAYQQPK